MIKQLEECEVRHYSAGAAEEFGGAEARQTARRGLVRSLRGPIAPATAVRSKKVAMSGQRDIQKVGEGRRATVSACLSWTLCSPPKRRCVRVVHLQAPREENHHSMNDLNEEKSNLKIGLHAELIGSYPLLNVELRI